MKLSVELKQQRAAKLQEIEALNKKAESRSFTDEEQKQFDTLFTEIENLAAQIDSAEKREKMAAQFGDNGNQLGAGANNGGTTTHFRADGEENGEQKEKAKLSRNYRLLRAIDLAAKGKPLDGAEKEMHDEAIKEARELGLNVEGNVAVPSWMIGTQRRDLTATGPGGAGTTEGGYTIPTELQELIPLLEPRLQVEALGATMLRGLRGTIDFPKGNADAAAVWEGENDANAETSPTFSKITMTPHRLGAFTDISKQLMVQSSIDVENYVRSRLNFAVRKALDSAAINGSGSSNEPTGILNTAGIGSVAIGTDGGAPTWANIVGLETEIATDNADMGTLAYLTTPGVRGKLKTTLVDSGSGLFIWDNRFNPAGPGMNGYRAEVSTQVPSTLTKGANSDCHAIIFGNFAELMIGQWAGIDLVVDPYTGAKNALVTLVINSWWDIAVRHAESFAAIKDARIV